MDILPEKLQGKKASAVFLDYCEPLLQGFAAEKTTDLQLIHTGLRIPWMVWNAVILDNRGSTLSHVGSIRMQSRSAPPHSEEFLDFWIKRKNEQFSKYDYLMGEYQLKGKNIYDFTLRIEARE
ncbi:MAG: hypothetical protein HQK51_18815 [Oligoflexia bacterium]|nr:hypothetical protein [Oligoflexia bacterium]